MLKLPLIPLLLGLRLIQLLLLPDKIPEYAYFFIVVLVEVKPIAMTEPDLEQVVVETLLRNVYLLCRLLQG